MPKHEPPPEHATPGSPLTRGGDDPQPCGVDFVAKATGQGATREDAVESAKDEAFANAEAVCSGECPRPEFVAVRSVESEQIGREFQATVQVQYRCGPP